MIYLLPVLLALAAGFGPSLWAKWTLHRHNEDRADFPGTGGELAQHLVAELGLSGVVVEATDRGSHYDSEAKAVRLERRFFDGRSVSAVAASAHEVGHAIQDHLNYPPLRARHQLVRNTLWVQRVARMALYATPFAGLLGRHPGFALITILAGVLAMGISVIVHAITLPVEFDASFSRALPVLDEGGYLQASDMPAARSVLRACALTYVAGALMSMFNLFRWLRVLR